MRTALPQNIIEAFEKYNPYILKNGELDPNAPDDVKEAYETVMKWEKEQTEY